MLPGRRGTEIPVTRRSCNGTVTHLFPYGPAPEAPHPTAQSPLFRGQPDFPHYDAEFLQPAPNFFDSRYRGYPDRMSPRFLPYPGMEGNMAGMTHMVTPVRTVPTSITVPPSKQTQQPVAGMDLKQGNESHHLPFQNGHPGSDVARLGMRLQGTGLSGMERGYTTATSGTSIQVQSHNNSSFCEDCKSTDCRLGSNCNRVKSLWRHTSQCNLKDQCPEERSCRAPECWICSPLREKVKDIHHRIQAAASHRIKRETGEIGGIGGGGGGGTSLFPQERGFHPSPVRKTHFTPGLDPFPGDRRKGDFTGELDSESALFHRSPPSNYFMEPTDSFPLDPIPRQPSSAPTLPDSTKPGDQSTFQLGTSLFETFDPREIEQYLKAVRCCDSFPAKPDPAMKDKMCAVCLQGEQTFQPIQLYCDCCFARIKRGGMYWKTKPEAKVQLCACHKCFSSKKNGELIVGQMRMPQAIFCSCKNDECVTETWVACDKCGYWVHSSCGLFNRGENNDQAKYMCPFCLKEEMERGHRTRPISKPVSMWGANELARCPLSDFIQSELNGQITEEMRRLYLTEADCPPLTVCVLMSTKKATKVQPAVARSFPDLPQEFPYQQKVIGVFQKIHGVDVLLFCMYVQEYGDSPRPNQKWVNLEYIDSVKHFIPDIKTVGGEHLRSIVYKETLLAYVEFVKRTGFEVFYIWACPPGKEGEDYILHCKPKAQRIPSADRLRIWYKDLLKVAKERKIVTHDSNLMDTFFTCGMDRAVGRPFSAAEMPYFEGDYWPGEAEKILKALRSSKGVDYCRMPGKKRKTRGEMSLNESLENGLMISLPFPRWSDFMVWHLQEPCSLCQTYISSGKKYVYHFENASSSNNHNNNKHAEPVKKRAHFEGIKLGRPGAAHSNMQFFQICETCYQTCAVLEEGGPIPDAVNFDELTEEPVAQITATRGDYGHADENRFSEIFESRQAFLAFCKGNHYQFDTLQHAKHSTMMLLYHLHNTKAPVFPAICRGCGMEIPVAADPEKRDPRPPEFCRTCRMNGTWQSGVHGLPSLHSSAPSANNKMQFLRVADNFEHAAYCREDPCLQPECRRMKELFRHAGNCKVHSPFPSDLPLKKCMSCQIGIMGSCRACRFYALFVKRHAHFCSRQCVVPDCERIKAIRKQQMRLEQAQRSRVYFGEASGSSSSS